MVRRKASDECESEPIVVDTDDPSVVVIELDDGDRLELSSRELTAVYLLAGGDPGELERAKGTIKAALIGYALAVLAPVLVTVAQHIVG